MNSPSERPAEKAHALDSAEGGEAHVLLDIICPIDRLNVLLSRVLTKRASAERDRLLFYSSSMVGTLPAESSVYCPILFLYAYMRARGVQIAWWCDCIIASNVGATFSFVRPLVLPSSQRPFR